MESEAKEIVSATAATPAERRGKRRIAVLLVIAIILVGVGLLVWPWFRNSLGHVSTDDAIVNGHVTYVAPRISGHVEAVLVDDNQFVQKGDLLVRIDGLAGEDGDADQCFFVGDVREQRLPAVTGGHQARAAVQRRAEVVTSTQFGDSGVQPHP